MRTSSSTLTSTFTPPHLCWPADAQYVALHDEEWALPPHAEVVHIAAERGAPYPGVFIFTEVGGQGVQGVCGKPNCAAGA